MPRSCRPDIPGVGQHVIQRGNDRRPCFFAEIDYVHYLQDLRDIARRERCAVHAYVLMTNHVQAYLGGDDRYVLLCHRYIDLNPLRAHGRRSGRLHPLKLPLPCPWPTQPAADAARRNAAARPKNATARQRAYCDLVAQAIDPAETDAIRPHIQHQQATPPIAFAE